jgi:hypothetical protein
MTRRRDCPIVRTAPEYGAIRPRSDSRGWGALREIVGLALLSLPVLAAAQSAAPAADATAQGAASSADSASSMEKRLERLEQRQQDLERQLQQKDAEIQDLKRQQAKTASPPSAQPSAAAQPGVAKQPPAPAPPSQGSGAPTAAGVSAAAAGAAAAATPVSATTAAAGSADAQVSPAPQTQQPATGAAPAPREKWGTYTDNLGFKVANTDKGDMSVSIYTYVRYLNQLASDPTYTYASTGQTSSIDRRQEIQILKVQIKFLGWLFSPNFRYFLYAWSSNANQGLGAQVVLAGNLNYTFSKYFTLSGGITSLPGVRSTEGNFPFWLNVDNRMMADEFMRPSYTSGVWAKGDIAPGLRYQVMLGNNLSTLGVSSAQLNAHLDTLATALVWMPTTHEFGLGFGDFENHQQVATRFALHYTHSVEDKQSQPNTDAFENTQIRLSDGAVVFTPNLFGPGITVDELRYQMSDVDAGIKYHGMALEGEYYWRKLDQFQGPGTESLRNLYDRGFQLQASAMVIDKRLQLYTAGSRVAGEYGNPWDFRVGVNFFPWKNRVFRWNTQAMYLYKSPVGYTSLTYNVGSTGWIFNTDFELAL